MDSFFYASVVVMGAPRGMIVAGGGGGWDMKPWDVLGSESGIY